MNWNHEHAWEHTVCCDESGNTAIYDKPFFQNVCGHAPGTFLVGVKCWTNLGQVKQYDVYVFENVHGGQSVCIRASDEPGDYSSPGTVLDLLIAARSVHASHYYRAAAHVIDTKLRTRFEKVEEADAGH